MTIDAQVGTWICVCDRTLLVVVVLQPNRIHVSGKRIILLDTLLVSSFCFPVILCPYHGSGLSRPFNSQSMCVPPVITW